MGALLLQTVNVIGLGSLSRFYGAELVPRKLLLKSVSTLAILEALVRVVPEFSFYPLAHTIGGYYFIVFIVPTVFFLVLIWYYCPETKGRSVNDVLNDMAEQKGLGVMFHVAESKPIHKPSTALKPSVELPIIIALRQWGVDVTHVPKPIERRSKSFKLRSIKRSKIAVDRSTSLPV
jgi:hypothetical protein